jgi:hypothetical protein
MLAYILQKQFWTLSVLEGEAALQEFVGALPHSHVMRVLQEKMGQTHFVRWTMRGAELPPRWPAALARQEAA